MGPATAFPCMVDPTPVEKAEFSVVGLHYQGTNEEDGIGELWAEVQDIESSLSTLREGRGFYGVSFGGDPETGEFEYVAGVRATESAEPPSEMTEVEVPAATYLRIGTTLQKIEATMRTIHTEWLPSSSFELAMGPEFERYPAGFDRSDPDATFQLFVPVLPEEP